MRVFTPIMKSFNGFPGCYIPGPYPSLLLLMFLMFVLVISLVQVCILLWIFLVT
jgi:hypothetical protein